MFPQGLNLSLGKIHFSLKNFFFPRGTMLSPSRSFSCLEEQLKPFSPQKTIMSLGRKNLSWFGEQIMCLGNNHVPRGINVPKTLFDRNFCIWTLIWVLQLQSCSPLWNLSSDRSQAYINSHMKWLWLQKHLEHMFLGGTWAFQKFITSKWSCFFLRGT